MIFNSLLVILSAAKDPSLHSRQAYVATWILQSLRSFRMTKMLVNTFSLMLVMMTLSACGIKGDLVRPSDIPAYEEKLEKRDGSLPL